MLDNFKCKYIINTERIIVINQRNKNAIESDHLLDSSNESRMPSCVLINRKLLGSISSYMSAISQPEISGLRVHYQHSFFMAATHVFLFSSWQRKNNLILLLEDRVTLSYSWCLLVTIIMRIDNSLYFFIQQWLCCSHS